MSILLVDDNTLLLTKVARSLVRANRTVRTATSLQEARELMHRRPPQVLCLDVQLPDGNGLDLLAELRRDGRNLPVVVISGHHSPENRARAKQLGAAGFLAKPFALSELHALLAVLLADVRSRNLEREETVSGTRSAEAGMKPVTPLRVSRPRRACPAHSLWNRVRARKDQAGKSCQFQRATRLTQEPFPDDYVAIRHRPCDSSERLPVRLSSCILQAIGGLGGTG